MNKPTVGFYEEAFSYERGTPLIETCPSLQDTGSVVCVRILKGWAGVDTVKEVPRRITLSDMGLWEGVP